MRGRQGGNYLRRASISLSSSPKSLSPASSSRLLRMREEQGEGGGEMKAVLLSYYYCMQTETMREE